MEADKIADKVSKELERICKKYNCEIGVWLTWRDLLHNFDLMKKDNSLNELQFGLQIRLEDANDQSEKGNKGTNK
jgi:hypothetical protein